MRVQQVIVIGKWNFLSPTTKVTLCLPGFSETFERGAMGVVRPVSRPSF